MKKVYLALILSVFGILNLRAQTYTLPVDAYSRWDGSWTGAERSVWQSSAAPSSPGSGTIIVSKGATFVFADDFFFNGKIEIYGTVIFEKSGGAKGRLVMNDASEVWIAKDGDVQAVSDQGNPDAGINSTWIEIGGAKLNGSEINTVQSPDMINKTTIEEGTSCANNQNCNFAPLPVNLLHFTATAQQKAVKIEWASSKAWDFSHYELERSVNGEDFEYLTSIDAEENTDWVVNYSYSDHQPLNGTSYYRLKAVDIDGSFEYKGIEVVQFAGIASLKAYPNPVANGTLNVRLDEGENARLSLRDNSGRTVYAATMKGRNQSIDTSSLQPGMYVLMVEGAGVARQTQVIIQ